MPTTKRKKREDCWCNHAKKDHDRLGCNIRDIRKKGYCACDKFVLA